MNLKPWHLTRLLLLVLGLCITLCRGEHIVVSLQPGKATYRQDDEGYTVIPPGKTDFAITAEAGHPALPVRTVLIAIPPDAVVSGITFEGHAEPVAGTHRIRPAPPKLTTTQVVSGLVNEVMVAYEAVREEAYATDGPTPENPATRKKGPVI